MTSCSFSFFFLWTENEIILPLKTASPVSQMSVGDDFGESFISRKDAHSLLPPYFLQVFATCSCQRTSIRKVSPLTPMMSTSRQTTFALWASCPWSILPALLCPTLWANAAQLASRWAPFKGGIKALKTQSVALPECEGYIFSSFHSASHPLLFYPLAFSPVIYSPFILCLSMIFVLLYFRLLW